MKKVYACRVIVTQSYECLMFVAAPDKHLAVDKGQDDYYAHPDKYEPRLVNHGRKFEIYAADAHEVSPGGVIVDVEA